MGTQLSLSTSSHPQTRGQRERVIQILKDMPRACILDSKGNLSIHLLLVEFACNNCESSIGMVPSKALYGNPCKSPLCCAEAEERSVVGPDLI